MGLLSLFKNLNFGFGMPHMPTTTSASSMQAKEFMGLEQGNKLPLVGDHHEITGVEKDTRIKSDEIGSCTYGMDWKFNYPSRKDNVEGKLEEVVSGQRRLTKFKGDRGLGNVASLENAGQIECKVNFLGLPIRPGEKNCPFYMRTGGCKFASRCWFHHPDPIAVVGDVLQDRKNGAPSQHHGPVEQLCETLRPSENTSSEQTAFLGPFTPNRGVQQNVHWIGNPTTTSLLHPQETNINDQRKTLANKDIGYEFSGVELQQFEEYPQRPSEPECQYFMKTGYCKFKSACRYHHPKSNVSFSGLPEGLVSDNYQHHDPIEQLRVIPLPSENCSNEPIAFCVPSTSYVPDLFTPNQGLKPNAQWNENQTITGQLHPPEIIKTIDQQQELANNNTAYEFNDGERQQFDEYPQRPSELECQYFRKTGYCKFKSAYRYHHPKSNLSSLSLPLRLRSNNYEKDGPAEQLCEVSLPSENASNDQTAFFGPSSSNVPGLFTPNLGLQPNVQWNGDQMATSPLDPPEIKIDEKGQELTNKDTAYEFNGDANSQQFDEYPQRPSEPQCQYFMKTGSCKFKSACRFHHPKPNLSVQASPLKSMAASPLHPPPPETKKNEKAEELANKDIAHEFNGGVKSKQFDEYPQRPGEPECQHFMKTGYCKFKSACRCHHPKSNLSFPARRQKPDKPICTHFSRSGICKFGSACRFSHHIEHI